MAVRTLPRLSASLLASAGIHALAIALALRAGGPFSFPDGLPRARLIHVSLVSLPGGGGGAAGASEPAAPAPAVAPPPPPEPAVRARAERPKPPPPPARKAKARSRPTPTPAPAAVAASPVAEAIAPAAGGSDASAGGARSGAPGGGDGTGGDGSGGARPAYGTNPKPPYPLAARRLGQEGRVWLAVVVRPDGRPATVTITQSSGHRLLDETAADTVRSRWRFLPARRDGVPVESTVTFPIRFRLEEG